MLSSVFDSNDDIDILANRFIKKLNGCIKMCFRKIRITNKRKQTKIEILYDQLSKIKIKNGSEKEMEDKLNEIAVKNNKTIENEIKCNTEAGSALRITNIWKLKKQNIS